MYINTVLQYSLHDTSPPQMKARSFQPQPVRTKIRNWETKTKVVVVKLEYFHNVPAVRCPARPVPPSPPPLPGPAGTGKSPPPPKVYQHDRYATYFYFQFGYIPTYRDEFQIFIK